MATPLKFYFPLVLLFEGLAGHGAKKTRRQDITRQALSTQKSKSDTQRLIRTRKIKYQKKNRDARTELIMRVAHQTLENTFQSNVTSAAKANEATELSRHALGGRNSGRQINTLFIHRRMSAASQRLKPIYFFHTLLQ